MSARLGVLAAGVVGLVALAGAPAPKVDRRAWLEDYQQLKTGLELSYSHLAWLGSPDSGVDLPALDKRTLAALQHAKTDAEANDAITHFLEGLKDGHISRWSAPAVGAAVEPPKSLSHADGPTACASWGYAPQAKVPFSLPFETLPGFTLESDGLSEAFRAGVLEVKGRRLGIVRIQRFRAQEFAPICVQAWKQLRARDGGTSADDVAKQTDSVWLETLAQRLRRFRSERVDAVVVDVGGNGGGNDLGDWAVRAFTPNPVRSAPLWMVASDGGLPWFDGKLSELRGLLDAGASLPPATRAGVESAIAHYQASRTLAAQPPCAMNWVWKERRPWGTSSCTRLVEAGSFSGPFDYVDAGTFDARAANSLYWATAADGVRGAWNGKTFVLTNEQTGSAAECFTALMRDRHIALTVGVRTNGLGCGFMGNPAPILLAHSKLGFTVPNCVRLRSDGTDEVFGIVPDLPVAPMAGESPRGRAARVAEAIARALDDASAP